MDKEKIKQKLSEINYPGFSRDIVSFGMIDDIILDKKSIKVILKISTSQNDKKDKVRSDVIAALASLNLFESIDVDFSSSSASSNNKAGQNISISSTIGQIKNIIAVASGKGGVGKSTISANLALSFKKLGYKTGLLDLDIYGPSLPTVLGINGQPEMTNQKKLVPLDHLGLKIMSFGFISGNKTPVIWRGPLVSRMTEQFFGDVVWGDLDVLVLDLPPGTGDIQLTLTQKLKLTGAVIVTTPQDLALADVKKGADMFNKVQTPILGVIENMSGLFLQGKVNPDSNLSIEGQDVKISDDGRFGIRVDLFKKGGGKIESERLNVPLLGELPISQDIMEATDSGKPIIEHEPESQIALSFKEIAEKIARSLKDV